MPSLSTLNASLLTQVSQRRSTCYLIELDIEGRPKVEQTPRDMIGITGNSIQLAFQYFPETISDSKAVNYQTKEIPGGSLPLYQWINGGARAITFTATFTTDVDLLALGRTAQGTASLFNSNRSVVDRLDGAGASGRNIDIRAACAWLRGYLYPSYDSKQPATIQGFPLTTAPSKLRLVMPSSGIGLIGMCPETPDSVRVIMTQCDIVYEAYFPSGLPRIATVQLGFAEVAQAGGNIFFPQRDKRKMDKAVATFTFGYNLPPRGGDGSS